MTTWHADFNEAAWYAIFAAHNPPEIIDTVFCLDASEIQTKSKLRGFGKALYVIPFTFYLSPFTSFYYLCQLFKIRNEQSNNQNRKGRHDC
jgi:hypothetical protein